MNTERLVLMRDMLEEINRGDWRPTGPLAPLIKVISPRVNFTLRTWGDWEPEEEDDEGDQVDCGFHACAIGCALLDERFQAMGLKDSYQEEILAQASLENTFDEDGIAANLDLIPAFEGTVSYSAPAHFFDLGHEIVHWVFDPDHYHFSEVTDAQAVIERLNRVLSGDIPQNLA